MIMDELLLTGKALEFKIINKINTKILCKGRGTNFSHECDGGKVSSKTAGVQQPF